MPSNYFPDGFPQDPQEAIEAAFFLSEEEKVEWRTFLTTANESEKKEFVETLHSIFSDQNTPTSPVVQNSNSQSIQNASNPVQNNTQPANVNVQNAQQPLAESNFGLPLQNANVFGPGALNNAENSTNTANINPQQVTQPVQNIAQNPTPSNALDFDFSDLEKELESQNSPAIEQPVFYPTPTAENNSTPPINKDTFNNNQQQFDFEQPQVAQQPIAPFNANQSLPVEAKEPKALYNDDEDFDDDFSDLSSFTAGSSDFNSGFDLSAPKKSISAYEAGLEANLDSSQINSFNSNPPQPAIQATEPTFAPTQKPSAILKTPEGMNNFASGIKTDSFVNSQPVITNPNPNPNPNSNANSNSNVGIASPMAKEIEKNVQNYERELIKQDSELKTDIDNMLTPVKEKSIKTDMIETFEESDYNSEINRSERYQKLAKTSLLSARQVSELYDTFLDTQTKSTQLEKEYQNRQANLFNKIMEMVTEAGVLSDKVLRLNDIGVIHAADIKALQISTGAKSGISLQSQINSLREEIRKVERSLSFSIESVEREFSEFRSEITAKVDEISIQLTSAIADTYKVDGVYEKLAKIVARIDLIEGKDSGEVFFKEAKSKNLKSKSILSQDDEELEKEEPSKELEMEKTLSFKSGMKPSLSLKDLKKN